MRYLCSVVTLLLLMCAMLPAQTATVELPKLQHLSADQVNPQIDPCSDFYQYTCSKFFAANPIPADRATWGVIGPLSQWNEAQLRIALEAAAAKKQGRTAIEQKIGDFWSSCTDEDKVDASSGKTLKLELQRIDAIKSKSQLAEQIAHLHMTLPGAWQGADASTPAPLFGFSASQDLDDATKVVGAFDQGGFSLPTRDFYLAKDEKSSEIRNKFLAHITNMLKLTGEPEAQAAKDAAAVLDLETALATASMDIVKRRDPKNLNNKRTLAEIERATPSFDWKRYLALVHAPAGSTYLVSSPDFFRSLNELIEKRPLEQWKSYLRWQLVHQSAPYLARPFIAENFAFFGKALFGVPQQAPRWRRCARNADSLMGEAVGQAYVAAAFPGQSKERVTRMVKNIEAAMEQDINGLEWMSPATREQAKAKLHLILDKIGYPDHWRDYSSLEISADSYLENVHRATAFEFNRQLQKIGKPVDRYEWGMTPPTIDAYYDAQTNTINFPAGILQPPLFDRDQPDAANYGAEGSVIGHEITHGFDDQGRKFDGAGNLRDWWTAEDGRQYDERGKCISDQYTQEIPEAGVKQNGLLTQGEDTADNGGMRLALMALENSLKAEGKTLENKGADGLTEAQRFFLGFGNVWCTQYRPEVMRTQVLSNPHSLPRYRVNNTVANMPEFARAFGCKKGQPLVRENACRVW
ncbi:MAG: M13 family metallopeptidase [Acidobacteriia bacterium]|nr:M13 family metallopeptidase [Terriglobia bacterium]